ncbi:transcription termination/antitermination protein NusG [Bradyrhizobium sp. Bra78]|uniref:transcription termination/antitermination protein NusG n=1 Tax=Bradyrhizobium sp. Bra78 TaxID=2926010 RepID=UPI0021C6D228|nr:transcription termination/antitermination NusG family protein [Bradyrhizobium sp. Bra78]
MHYLQGEFRNGLLPRVVVETDVKHWHLLNVYPGREAKVMRWFRYSGLQGWYPIEISYIRRGLGGPARKPHLGRKVVRPLVPGLIFVPDTETSEVMTTFPDVDGFHMVGDCLGRMPACDMARLRDIEAYLNTPRSERGHRGRLTIGELVKVVDGPFAEFIGKVTRLDSRGRLTVDIDAFKRSVSLQMDDTQIEPIASTPRG